jgi:hypothetical protein
LDLPKTLVVIGESRLVREKMSHRRLDYIGEMIEQKGEVYPYISPDDLMNLSEKTGGPLFLTAVPDVHTVTGEEDEGMLSFDVDEIGFRNRRGLYTDGECCEMFVQGDSYAHGCCVHDGFTISDQIERKSDMKVYNAATSGSGLSYMYGVYQEYVSHRKPQYVVINIVESVTLSRAVNELRKSAIVRAYYESTEIKPLQGLLGLAGLQREVLIKYIQTQTFDYAKGLLVRLIEEKEANGILFDLVQTTKNSLYSTRIYSVISAGGIDPSYRGEGYPDCGQVEDREIILSRVLQSINDDARSYGGQLIISYLPSTRYDFVEWPDCEYDMVRNTTTALGIPFVDMVKAIEERGNHSELIASNPLFPSLGGHYNRAGYELVADEVLGVIAEIPNR